MNLIPVIAALIFMSVCGLVGFTFMAFAGGSIANGSRFLKTLIANAVLWLFILACLIGPFMLLFAYFHEWSSSHYWWAALPVAIGVPGLVLMALIS